MPTEGSLAKCDRVNGEKFHCHAIRKIARETQPRNSGEFPYITGKEINETCDQTIDIREMRSRNIAAHY